MRDVGEPQWVRRIALGAALALAAFGGIGLLLADLGVYSLLLTLVLGLPAFVVLFRWARPVLQPEDDAGALSLTERNSAIAAVVLSAVSAMWNGANASEHVQINRDGGLYLNAGKWIAGHGTLNVQPFVGPFARTAGLVATSSGMKQQGTHLEFEISHMLPAFLAEAQNIGGNRLMFLTVPILGGAALLAFYLLACRLLQQPVAALGATATLALLMPQVSFSRDSTTEIPIQMLLFTSLWMLCDRRTLRKPHSAFVAGLLLGLVQAMHVDGLAFLVGLPAVFADHLAAHEPGRPRSSRRRLRLGEQRSGDRSRCSPRSTCSAGTARTCRSSRGNVERLAAVEIVAIAAAIGFVVLVRRTRLFDVIQRERGRVAYGAGALVLIVGFGAWFIRPMVQHVHAAASTRPSPRFSGSTTSPSTERDATPSCRCSGSAGTSGRSR